MQSPAEPSPFELAQSRRLTDLLRDRIAAAGGWLSFADYMAAVLYTPGLGYYAAGARKFGVGGDFVTAPELSPLFGYALARQVAQVLDAVGGEVLELGAGSGRLAVDLLGELARLGCLPERYLILEISPDLRARQQELLAASLPDLGGRLVWIDTLPTAFRGVVLGNEVLDALPVHLLHWRRGECRERGVAWAGEGFVWEERPLAEGGLREIAQALPVTADDFLSEVCPAAPALVGSLGRSLRAGMLLFLDYGLSRAEYYHPARHLGTLMCHFRQRAFDDPFLYPGLVDLTAHVDFTAIADAALEAGLEVLGYVSQAHFLVACGLLERLAACGEGSVEYFRQASAVQTLLQPTGMGERFKVMALGRGLELSPLGFAVGDRRHLL